MDRIPSPKSLRARPVLLSFVVSICLMTMMAAPAAALTTYRTRASSTAGA